MVGNISRGANAIVQTSIAWTSDAAGAVSGNTIEMPSGSVCSVHFIPGAGGVAPTTLYDVTFTNSDGINLFDDGTGLASIGANLSATVATMKVPFIAGASSTFVRAWLAGGLYTPVVANAGNAKEGTIKVFQILDVR